MAYTMKKTLIFTLSLSLLCGCASQNNSTSKYEKNEAETTAVTTTVKTTSSSTVTTSHTTTTTIITTTNSVTTTMTSIDNDEDFIWLEKGVYEVGYGERDADLPYDNRFEGMFYTFFDEKTGIEWDAYEGVISYFTCEQKKDKIIFHETNLTRNNSQAGIGVTYDYECHTCLDDEGNVKLGNNEFLVKLPADKLEYAPELFDARDYSDNYVPLDDKPHVLGFPHYKGKKIDE